jgi:hypothetical protein
MLPIIIVAACDIYIVVVSCSISSTTSGSIVGAHKLMEVRAAIQLAVKFKSATMTTTNISVMFGTTI